MHTFFKKNKIKLKKLFGLFLFLIFTGSCFVLLQFFLFFMSKVIVSFTNSFYKFHGRFNLFSFNGVIRRSSSMIRQTKIKKLFGTGSNNSNKDIGKEQSGTISSVTGDLSNHSTAGSSMPKRKLSDSNTVAAKISKVPKYYYYYTKSYFYQS